MYRKVRYATQSKRSGENCKLTAPATRQQQALGIAKDLTFIPDIHGKNTFEHSNRTGHADFKHLRKNTNFDSPFICAFADTTTAVIFLMIDII